MLLRRFTQTNAVLNVRLSPKVILKATEAFLPIYFDFNS